MGLGCEERDKGMLDAEENYVNESAQIGKGDTKDRVTRLKK